MNRYLNEDKFHRFLEQLLWFQLLFAAVVGGWIGFFYFWMFFSKIYYGDVLDLLVLEGLVPDIISLFVIWFVHKIYCENRLHPLNELGKSKNVKGKMLVSRTLCIGVAMLLTYWLILFNQKFVKYHSLQITFKYYLLFWLLGSIIVLVFDFKPLVIVLQKWWKKLNVKQKEFIRLIIEFFVE